MPIVGRRDWPSYMKEAHEKWLDKDHSDTVKQSITAMMSSAQTEMFKVEVENPTAEFFGQSSKLVINEFIFGGFAGLFVQPADVRGQLEDLKTEQAKNLAKVKAKHREQGSVQSSQFVVDLALEGTKTLRAFSALLSAEFETRVDVLFLAKHLELAWMFLSSTLATETVRINYVSYFQFEQLRLEQEAYWKLFNLRAYQSASKVLASCMGVLPWMKPEPELSQLEQANQEGNWDSQIGGIVGTVIGQTPYMQMVGGAYWAGPATAALGQWTGFTASYLNRYLTGGAINFSRWLGYNAR